MKTTPKAEAMEAELQALQAEKSTGWPVEVDSPQIISPPDVRHAAAE